MKLYKYTKFQKSLILEIILSNIEEHFFKLNFEVSLPLLSNFKAKNLI